MVGPTHRAIKAFSCINLSLARLLKVCHSSRGGLNIWTSGSVTGGLVGLWAGSESTDTHIRTFKHILCCLMWQTHVYDVSSKMNHFSSWFHHAFPGNFTLVHSTFTIPGSMIVTYINNGHKRSETDYLMHDCPFVKYPCMTDHRPIFYTNQHLKRFKILQTIAFIMIFTPSFSLFAGFLLDPQNRPFSF